MPGARGRVRRVAPRLGAGPRRRRVRHAAVGVHQRPRPHRPGPRAVHPPARSRRRARRRRHHRVVGRAGRLPRDAERVEHRAAASTRWARPRCCTGEASARSTTSPPTRVVLAVQGPEARARLAAVVPERGRGRPLRGGATSTSDGERGWIAGTGYTGEDGVELHVPAGAAAAVLASAARRRDHARRARRARHAAARGGAAAARPRARPGHHAAPGRARLGGALRQGRLPRSRRARGRARPRRRPAPARPASPRAARSRARDTRCSRGGDAGRRRSPAATSRRCSSHGIALAFLPPDAVDRRRGHRRRPRSRRARDRHEAAVRPPVASASVMADAGDVPEGVRRPSPRALDRPRSRPCSATLGVASVTELVDRAVPEAIRDRDAARPARRAHRGRGAAPGCASLADRNQVLVVADRPGLLGHDHAAGDPAQRAREPGLVHRVHAVPARDLAGPAARRSSTSRPW